MKDIVPYFPLLNLAILPAVWMLNDMRREIRSLGETQKLHGEAIARLQAADAVRHPGQQPQSFSFHAGGD